MNGVLLTTTRTTSKTTNTSGTGRLKGVEVDLDKGNAKFTIAAWARNLFNEQHAFYKSASIERGVSGFLNDGRTFGVEIGVKM